MRRRSIVDRNVLQNPARPVSCVSLPSVWDVESPVDTLVVSGYGSRTTGRWPPPSIADHSVLSVERREKQGNTADLVCGPTHLYEHGNQGQDRVIRRSSRAWERRAVWAPRQRIPSITSVRFLAVLGGTYENLHAPPIIHCIFIPEIEKRYQYLNIPTIHWVMAHVADSDSVGKKTRVPKTVRANPCLLRSFQVGEWWLDPDC